MTDQLQHIAYSSWVAIDIAKHSNVVMVELLDGKKRRFRMANSGKDHDRLIELIHELPQPCHIGFEATGNYHAYSRTLGERSQRKLDGNSTANWTVRSGSEQCVNGV